MTMFIIYLLFGLFLLLAIWLVFAYFKCVFKYPAQTLVATLLLIFLYEKSVESFQIGHLPAWLEANDVIYSKEESWGIGMPGDNETGLIVYELDAEIAKIIQKEGISYFNHLPKTTYSSNSEYYRRSYEGWKETPIQVKKHKNRDEGDVFETLKNIDDYLDKYGFGIPIDKKVASEINTAISKTGSYYAFGRTGILVIVPKQHKIVFMYAG